jgi:hypothetical protein
LASKRFTGTGHGLPGILLGVISVHRSGFRCRTLGCGWYFRLAARTGRRYGGGFRWRLTYPLVLAPPILVETRNRSFRFADDALVLIAIFEKVRNVQESVAV